MRNRTKAMRKKKRRDCPDQAEIEIHRHGQDHGDVHGLQTLNNYNGRNVEKFLIHPNLVRSAKIEWPNVDLDK
jgi:hypothetical protein